MNLSASKKLAVMFNFAALLCFCPACFSTDLPTNGKTTNQLGERLVLLKSGESDKPGLVSYGLYCVVSGSRAASDRSPGGDLLLIMRNNGAKWIDLEHVTAEDFSISDSQGKQMKLYLWTTPRGMAYGDSDVFHLIVDHPANSPQPWTLRFKSKSKAFVPVELSIAGIEPRSSERSYSTLDATNLDLLMKLANPSPRPGTNYSRLGWAQLVAVARVIQRSAPSSVGTALHEYQLLGCEKGKFEFAPVEQIKNDWKLYLVMRIVFDLPESVPKERKEWPWIGSWMTSGAEAIDSSGASNLAWPIKWNAGQPELIAECLGLQGQRYDAAKEYAYYQQKYRFRDLSEFKEEAKTK